LEVEIDGCIAGFMLPKTCHLFFNEYFVGLMNAKLEERASYVIGFD